MLGLPKERCQWYLLLPAKPLRLFDPISLFLILISLQKPLQMGKGKKKEKNKPQTHQPSHPQFLLILFFFFSLFSFPLLSPTWAAEAGGLMEEKLNRSPLALGCFSSLLLCFLTPKSRLKLLHSCSFTIARDTVLLVSADVPKVLCSPSGITSNFGKCKAWTQSRKMFLSCKSVFVLLCPKSNLFELEMLFEAYCWNS